jgi:predicted transcriptional regulator
MNIEAQTHELKVGEYMTPNPIHTVLSDITFADAATMMAKKRIGNLVVIENEKPVGILTEREIIQYLSQWLKIPNRLLEYVRVQPFEAVKPDTTIFEAAKTMISKKSRLLVFDSDSDNLVGIITASDIIKAFRTTDINPALEDVMTRKVFNLEYNRAVIRAIRMMHNRRIGSIIIFNKNTNKSKIPYGIFTERDLLTKILSRGIDLNEKVGDYCSTPLVTTQIGIRAIEAANLMYLNNMKRLVLTDPLSQDNNPVAIVTARDLVEAFQKN